MPRFSHFGKWIIAHLVAHTFRAVIITVITEYILSAKLWHCCPGRGVVKV